jgi:hypothetical protein
MQHQYYRRNSDRDLRIIERQAKNTGLPEDIEAYEGALRRAGLELCNCESIECGHGYPCLEIANFDTSTPVGPVCDRCIATIPSEFHNSDCWCRNCSIDRVGSGMMMKSNMSMSDIANYGFIPQFSAPQGPNMHWFGQAYNPSLENEKWHEWYVVSMSLKAYFTALKLGLSILPLSQQGFPVDPLNASADILMDEFLQWVRNRPSDHPPNFIIKIVDTYPLARYFALSSRRNYRGSGDYGGLEPGWGWGEYNSSYFGSRGTIWIAQPDFLDDDGSIAERLLREDFEELKAPDTGSIITDNLDFNRDAEWL